MKYSMVKEGEEGIDNTELAVSVAAVLVSRFGALD
jgi:hypothetical protein